jgi:hypothetical protein
VSALGNSQANNIRKALYKNWGISQEATVEENQNASIQLDVVGDSSQVISKSNNGFFGASLITHLSSQLMFLLKISLTSILILLITGLLFAFIPETLFRTEK